MLNFLKRNALRQELKKISSQKQFVEWGSVKSICIVVNNDAASVNAANAFRKESGKDVDIVIYTNDKPTANNEVYLSMNKKSFNWLDIPNADTLKKLQAKTYDLVVCGDLTGNTVLKAISFLVKAKCRVGSANVDYSKNFELSIADNANEGIGNFLKQALKYLIMIKAN